MNNESRKILALKLRYKSRAAMATRNIAHIALNFFKAGYKKEGQVLGTGLKPWKRRKFEAPGKSRQLLRQKGTLFRGLRKYSNKKRAVIYNNVPYATLLSEGGTVTITPAMRKFFWAMYYKYKSNPAQAKIWRSLALKQTPLKYPERPIVYHSKALNRKIERYIDKHIKRLQ
jgi:phage gpG-like protein